MPTIEIPGVGRFGLDQVAGAIASLLAIIGLVAGIAVSSKGDGGSSQGAKPAPTVTVTATATPTATPTPSIPLGRPAATEPATAKEPSLARDEARFRADALAYFYPLESVPGAQPLSRANGENKRAPGYDWATAKDVTNSGGKAKMFTYTNDGTTRFDVYRLDKEFYANFNGNFFNLVRDTRFANQSYGIAFDESGDYYYATLGTEPRQRVLTPEQEQTLRKLALQLIKS